MQLEGLHRSSVTFTETCHQFKIVSHYFEPGCHEAASRKNKWYVVSGKHEGLLTLFHCSPATETPTAQ